jgi:hypothetical protein
MFEPRRHLASAAVLALFAALAVGSNPPGPPPIASTCPDCAAQGKERGCTGGCVAIIENGFPCDPDLCSDAGRCRDGLSCYSLIGGKRAKYTCTDKLNLGLLSPCDTSSGKDYCGGTTFCSAPNCADVRRCSNPAGAGEHCDGDMNKPSATDACKPCGAGLTCVGATTAQDGICQQKCKDQSECDCVPGTTSALTCTFGQTTSPSIKPDHCTTCEKLHDSCSAASPCCDGSLCGDARQCCVGDISGHSFTQNPSDCCPGFYGTAAFMPGKGSGYVCNRCAGADGACPSGTDAECCGGTNSGIICGPDVKKCGQKCTADGTEFCRVNNKIVDYGATCFLTDGYFKCIDSITKDCVPQFAIGHNGDGCAQLPPTKPPIVRLLGYAYGTGTPPVADSTPTYNYQFPSGETVKTVSAAKRAWAGVVNPNPALAAISVSTPSSPTGVNYTVTKFPDSIFARQVTLGSCTSCVDVLVAGGNTASWYEMPGSGPPTAVHAAPIASTFGSTINAIAIAPSPFFGESVYDATIVTSTPNMIVQIAFGNIDSKKITFSGPLSYVPVGVSMGTQNTWVVGNVGTSWMIEERIPNPGLPVFASARGTGAAIAVGGGTLEFADGCVNPTGTQEVVVLARSAPSKHQLTIFPSGYVGNALPPIIGSGEPVALRVTRSDPQDFAWVAVKKAADGSGRNAILRYNISTANATPDLVLDLGLRTPIDVSIGNQSIGCSGGGSGAPKSVTGMINVLTTEGGS